MCPGATVRPQRGIVGRTGVTGILRRVGTAPSADRPVSRPLSAASVTGHGTAGPVTSRIGAGGAPAWTLGSVAVVKPNPLACFYR